MIKVYYSELREKTDEELVLRYLLKALPPDLQNEIRQYRHTRDRSIRTVGKFLLRMILVDLGYSTDIMSNIVKNKYGKPKIPGTIDFNISHSGDIVICVASDKQKVGVDIEAVRNIDIVDFKDCFTDNEWCDIEISKNRIERFFDLWAKKESMVKANGRGIFVDLRDVTIVGNEGRINDTNTSYFFSTLDEIINKKEYAAYICTNEENAAISYKKIDISHTSFDGVWERKRSLTT